MLSTYYNHLAPYYKYLFLDWNASVARQAAVLDHDAEYDSMQGLGRLCGRTSIAWPQKRWLHNF